MNKWEKIGKLPFNEKHKKYLKEKLESIKQDITSMKPDKEQEILLCYYADHLLHYLSFDAQEREKQMADNISRLYSLYPDEKIIYMAHNLHVGNIHKGKKKMSRSEIEKAAEMEKSKAVRTLNSLIEKKILKKTGAGRGVRYTLK